MIICVRRFSFKKFVWDCDVIWMIVNVEVREGRCYGLIKYNYVFDGYWG